MATITEIRANKKNRGINGKRNLLQWLEVEDAYEIPTTANIDGILYNSFLRSKEFFFSTKLAIMQFLSSDINIIDL